MKEDPAIKLYSAGKRSAIIAWVLQGLLVAVNVVLWVVLKPQLVNGIILSAVSLALIVLLFYLSMGCTTTVDAEGVRQRNRAPGTPNKSLRWEDVKQVRGFTFRRTEQMLITSLTGNELSKMSVVTKAKTMPVETQKRFQASPNVILLTVDQEEQRQRIRALWKAAQKSGQ